MSKSQRSCPNCGELAESKDIFCPYCGSPLPESTEKSKPVSRTTDTTGLVCARCGSVNETYGKFCRNCGASLAAAQQAPSATVSTSSSTTYTYGSGAGAYAEEERAWYTPPRRSRPAYHPVEWFFWSGWGIYILIRVILQIFWLAIFFGACRRR